MNGFVLTSVFHMRGWLRNLNLFNKNVASIMSAWFRQPCCVSHRRWTFLYPASYCFDLKFPLSVLNMGDNKSAAGHFKIRLFPTNRLTTRIWRFLRSHSLVMVSWSTTNPKSAKLFVKFLPTAKGLVCWQCGNVYFMKLKEFSENAL